MKKVAEINGIAIKDTSALDALSAVSDIITMKLYEQHDVSTGPFV